MTFLAPMRFDPIFQYRPWGGRRLGDWMDSTLPDGPIGEAWVFSDRDDHSSRVAEGPLKGQTITQIMAHSRDLMLGHHAARFDRFPLLLKFLDVEQMLSVQVHPRDNDHALIPKGERGKSEAWIVLAADANSRIYAGLNPNTTAQDLRDLTTDSVDAHLASFKPQTGEALMIDAGTVHSLGDGVMVFEVQENSDVTYRLYDWDHIDAHTGKPRDLQIEDALTCVDFTQGAILPVAPVVEAHFPARRERVFDDEHFAVVRFEGAHPFAVGAAGEPRLLVCLAGAGVIEHDGSPPVVLQRGGVVLLPASVGVCRVEPAAAMTLIEIGIPGEAA